MLTIVILPLLLASPDPPSAKTLAAEGEAYLEAAGTAALHLPPMEIWMHQLLEWLALPQFGLGTVFIVSFVSATLLPVGSEAAVFGLIKLNPDLFWPAIGVGTLGNTLGGGVSWWMPLTMRSVGWAGMCAMRCPTACGWQPTGCRWS